MAADYVGRILEKFPRSNKEQLAIIGKLQGQYTETELAKAVEYCVDRDLYSADEFRATLMFLRKEEPAQPPGVAKLPEKYSMVQAQERPLSDYSRALGGGAPA
jgi:hypothetical protein